MSQQCCLLIALCLLLSCVLAAQSEFTLHSEIGLLQDSVDTGSAAYNKLDWNLLLAPYLELEASADLNAKSLTIAPNIQKLWHNASFGASFQTAGFRAHAAYHNLAFGNSQLLSLYPDWDPLLSQERLTQHQGTFVAGYSAPFLQTEAYAQTKHLRYTPYLAELNMETFEMDLVQQPNTGVSDQYYGLRLAAPIIKGLSANLAADYKDGSFASAGEYRLTGLTAGLTADYKLLAQSTLSAAFNWTNRTGLAVPKEKRNLLECSLRYQQRISPDLAGYLLYINNSCLDSGLDTLSVVSNYLRAQLQYSFPSDPSGGSYLLFGAKYSPENKADAYFASTDYRVIGNLYTGVAVNFQPERQTTWSGKIGYYYTPVNELHLQYSHRENSFLDFETDYIGFGSSLYW